MKVTQDEGEASLSKNEDAIDTERSNIYTDRSNPRHHTDKKVERGKETSKRKERLKRLRKHYQAELVKNLKFFQSARPYVELGSKPLSVQQSLAISTENIHGGKGDAMEQLD